MKNKFLLIVLLSLLPFIFIFSNNTFFYTQDGWSHLARGGAFYKALQDGQFPVRWAGDLNYGYGMPLFNFVFQMPFMIMSLFILLGFGLVNSLKIITLLSFVFSGIFMYLFSREFFKDENKALLVTIFYQFFPFRLVEMFVRGSIGEMYAFTFFPLILYGITIFFKKSWVKASLIVAVGTAGIILSHLATGLVFILIAILFAIIFSPQIKKTLFILLSMGWGLGLSAFYWVPAFLDHKYTYGSLFAKDLYSANFVPFVNFFIPNFLNIPTLRMGDVPIQVGLFHTIALLVGIGVFVFYKKLTLVDKKFILFCLLIVALSFFIMQPISLFIWKNVPLMEQFQFPWRFLSSAGFGMSMLAVYFLVIPSFKRSLLFGLLLILVVGSTAFYWYPQLGFRKVDENYYWNYPLDTTYFGETNLIWSAGPASKYPTKRVEIIGGKASVTNIKEKSNLHTYKIVANENSQVVDHTQFFPGWKVLVDGQSVPIQFQDQLHRGEITYFVPRGKHDIKVIFGETKNRLFADIISITSFMFIFGLFFVKKFKLG